MYAWNIIRHRWVYYVIFRHILLTNFNLYRLLLWKLLVCISTCSFWIIFCIAEGFLLYNTMVGRITKGILKSLSVVVQGNFNYFLKKVKFLKEKKGTKVDALERCWDLFNLQSSLKFWILLNCLSWTVHIYYLWFFLECKHDFEYPVEQVLWLWVRWGSVSSAKIFLWSKVLLNSIKMFTFD